MALVKIILICLVAAQCGTGQLYVGCYKDFLVSSNSTTPVQSVDECLNKCKTEKLFYGALRNINQCYCGNITHSTVPSSNCNLICIDNNGTCGGVQFYSVYAVVPSYLGCYKDDEQRDMKISISDNWHMTIEKCYDRCSSDGSTVMGVQYSGTCTCGIIYGRYGHANETECSMKCGGNQKQICGGGYRNSIYSVGMIRGLNKKYSEVFHCLHGNTDANGVCKNKTCQTGWKGVSCNIRDCYVQNGHCGEHKCKKFVIGNKITSECECNEGYESASNFDECTANQSGTWKIVGAVVGCISALLLVIVLVLVIRCALERRKNHVNTKGKTNKMIDTNEEIDSHKAGENSVNYVGIADAPNNTDIQETKLKLSQVGKYFCTCKAEVLSQFQKCPKEFGQSQKTGSLPENLKKNRFNKILPYDHNRVKLANTGVGYSDYINASYVQTYDNPSSCVFIAAQGPKDQTAADFWRMIYEQKVKIIVMLTRCFEEGKSKCFEYWPDDQSQSFGDFTIKLEKEEKRLNYELRTLKITSVKTFYATEYEELHVYHFLYTAWMDKSVPDNVFSLMNLREKMLSLLDQQSENHVVVHCSAGIGRTGTFISLDYLMRQAENEGYVDVYKCMKFLRNQRYNMIQANTQYELCYRAMAMFHLLGKSTFISTVDVKDFTATLKKINEGDHSLVEKQFELIQEQVGIGAVKYANRVPVLHSSVEIDAIYAPNSKRPGSYMIGLMPKKMNCDDFLNLFVGNYNAMIFLDINNPTTQLDFIPRDYQPVMLKGGSIQLCDKEDTDFGVIYSLRISKNTETYIEDQATYENTKNKDQQTYMNSISIFTFLHVTTSDVSSLSTDLITQLYLLSKIIPSSKERNIVSIFSSKGYEDAGYLVAAMNLIEMIENYEEVDVYETVFELRNVQPKIIEDLDSYRKLYSFVHEYLNHVNYSKKQVTSQRNTMMEHTYANQAMEDIL